MKQMIPGMLRRRFLYGFAAAPAALLEAQQQNSAPGKYQPVPLAPDQGGIVYWSTDDLKKAHATLAAAAAKGQSTPTPRDVVNLPITHTHAYNFLCRYPISGRQPRAEFHQGNTDIYFVQAGGGTITVGGQLDPPEPVAGELGEFQSNVVKGGKDFHLKPGDVLNIPPATPHITHPDPGGVSYMLVKVNLGMYPWTQVAGYPAAAHPAGDAQFSGDLGGIWYWPAENLKKGHELLTEAAAKGQPRPIGDLVPTPVTRTHLYDFVSRYPTPGREPRAEYHEGCTDIYFIVGGSATMTVGGELVEPTQSTRLPGEFQGAAVRGGKAYRVKAGDVINIPPATAHLTHPDPGGLTYMLLKVNIGMWPWNIVATQQRGPK